MKNLKNAYFAGGCFWCMEGIFEAQDGVKEAIVGYMGGDEKTANYADVSSGKTNHREGIKVIYNPDIISYEKLVELFWTQIDPTDEGGQFADRGFQYTTAMYYDSEIEKEILEKSKKVLEESSKFDKPVVTEILPFTTFFEAEDYHQNYYKKSSINYDLYSQGSGRKGFIEDNWKNRIKEIETNKEIPKAYTKDELKTILTPLQYKVTQEQGTEPAFNNEYWNNNREGIYVDIVNGKPLFSSTDKFDSSSGWPSFTKPIDENFIKTEDDFKLFSKRTEVKTDSSHLGHVFEDGPINKGGLRYCINSAALKFIPKNELKGTEYEKYLFLFDNGG